VKLASGSGQSVQQQASPPSALGKYNLIASLGKGGMAEVYLAVVAGPGGFNKLLVVKVLLEETYSGTEEGVRMFWDEARLSAQLVHPNIVHTYEVGEIAGRYFLAMEYLDGQTYRGLQIRASTTGALPLHEELRILAETARGLHYAHQLKRFDGAPLGVVHRDVSPQNVFVTYDGQVKVLDFGIAKTHDAEHLTQVGVIKGKLDYIAPEQLRGDPLDGRADVFALGAMLWETLSHKRFGGGRAVPEAKKVYARVVGGEPKLREVKPDVPEELAQIVDRAIAVDPAARFQDAAEFADAIDAYIESIGKRPTAKSLSTILSTMFERERATIHQLIDQKLSAIQRGEFNGDLSPLLDNNDPRSTSGVYVGELSTGGMSVAKSGVHGAAALTPPHGTPDKSLRRSRLPLVLAVVGAVSGAAVLALWPGLTGQPHTETATAEKTTPSAASPAAMAPSEPARQAPLAGPTEEARAPRAGEASITLVASVTPPNAHLAIDGAPIEVPFKGEFIKSFAMHSIEATADGYKPFRRIVSFSENRTLDIVLERLPVERPRPVARHTGPTRPSDKPESGPTREPEQETTPAKPAIVAPGVDISPRPRVKPANIDLSNPYANTN
jgi:eukaryotic-like serine/threonine-protein kinase